MPDNHKQVFLTQSPTRWQRFKWTFRIIVFIVVVLLVILGIAVTKDLFTPAMPTLKSDNGQYQAILNGGKNAAINAIDKKYQGFGKYITGKAAQLKHIRYVSKADSLHASSLPVRAAFYDASDEQAYFSLKNNIGNLNMLLPLWMTIDSTADTLLVNSDIRGQEIIKASGVPVVAVISNFSGEDFNGAPLHRILNDNAKKERLIGDLVKVIQQNHFAGINIDFEELQETSDEPLISFMKELYERLHAQHLLVTQDVSPFNSDYDLKQLSKYNDYVFLMAYDEHNSGSAPGSISSQRWIQAALDDAVGQMDSSKLVLAIAGYGYDWAKGDKGVDVTYEEALSIASDEEAKVVFDTATYNLSYNYTDNNEVAHTVYFTDAATNFNTMRFASEYGVGGVALWRLGSADSRLWTFYNRDLDDVAIDTFKYNVLDDVQISYDVDYIGEGEILDVITTPKPGHINVMQDTAEDLITNEDYQSMPSIFVIRKFGKKPKKIVLSFDDGPDERYTPRIIDILSKEHVPSVFFMIGINAVNNIPIVKRIYNEGFEIGNHTFTHPNIALVSRERALVELNSTRLLIESITGHSTVLFRAPYNADSEPETREELDPVAFAKENKYLTVGESIDPNDWEKGVSADTIFSRVVQQQALGSIILLHDAGGNREQTIIALPRIIKYFKDKGYTFTTVADLVNESRAQLMPVVPKNNSYYFIQFSYYMAEFGYWGGHVLLYLFIICVILSVVRILILAFFATKEFIAEKKQHLPLLAGSPLISIIVPAYNEEVNAVRSVENLLLATYPNFNIIFIDDGSKDTTYAKVSATFRGNERVKVMTKANGGKASALNYGIAQTEAAYVLCIDADTNLAPNALELLARHFADEKTGAVAGNVKVGNTINMLTRWQNIEYITSQNFDRNAFARINAITVVPGAIGLFKKKAIEDAGGFTSDTFAEDCDLTMRMLRAGYFIKNENEAIAMTEAPETLNQFLKQRFRWSFGVMQSFWKNRDALFNRDYGPLGMVALPNILLFQILIPLIAPLADVLMFVGILTGNGWVILEYYGLFMLVDLAVGVLAFVFEKESVWKLVWLIPQRIVYRWLMLYILYKAIRRAIRGQLQSWGVLKRTGNMKENPRFKSFKI
jgi:cellulose synthase/poly-beta-1,6-N-acetylglucosamine synthase-like glycosyltransferase/spore germination protein YaaH/peptidoglycan/xylan/chitin deacetylase (PgdA/CDA1 family)